MSDVTRILNAIEKGDPQAAGQLLPLVYRELRTLAEVKLRQETPGNTLDATAPRTKRRANTSHRQRSGYLSELRNFTSGTAYLSLEPSHCAPVREELVEVRAVG